MFIYVLKLSMIGGNKEYLSIYLFGLIKKVTKRRKETKISLRPVTSFCTNRNKEHIVIINWASARENLSTKPD